MYSPSWASLYILIDNTGSSGSSTPRAAILLAFVGTTARPPTAALAPVVPSQMLPSVGYWTGRSH